MQSVSLTLQFLRGRPPTWKTLGNKVRTEVIRALLLGIASGISCSRAQFFWHQPALTFCLLGGIAAGMTCAAGLGVFLPTLLRPLRRDPHVASGPLVLAVSDMLTLVVYFSLAAGGRKKGWEWQAGAI